MIEKDNKTIRVAYMRPDMPIIEAGTEACWLYDTFGDPNEIKFHMNINTFDYLLKRVGCNLNSQIVFYEEPQFIYGYEVIIDNRCPDNYIYISDIMAEYI